jgi:hypothetical protein
MHGQMFRNSGERCICHGIQFLAGTVGGQMQVDGPVDQSWRSAGMELSHGDEIAISSPAWLSRGCNAHWNNFARPSMAMGAIWG